MKRTTVIIDEELIKKAMGLTGIKTKRKAIEMGLKELIKSRHQEALREELGSYTVDLSYEELMELRRGG